MNKSLLLLSIFLIFNACKKDDDQLPYVSSNNPIVEEELTHSSIFIEVDGFENLDGYLAIAIYNSEAQFDAETESYRDTIISGLSDNMSIMIDSIIPGIYAVSIFHDENQDGQLNVGVFNIPTEGFGFSNNPTIVFSKPTFNACKFIIEESQEIIIPITLKHL